MKKIILFVALATFGMSLNSCSSDDSGSSSKGGSITVKIDGVSKTFDNVNVTIDEGTFPGGEDYTILGVSATKGNDLLENITFSTYKGTTGSDQIWSFTYFKDGKSYMGTVGTFNIITLKNGDDNHLTGTFSGKVSEMEVEKNLTEGVFDIKY